MQRESWMGKSSPGSVSADQIRPVVELEPAALEVVDRRGAGWAAVVETSGMFAPGIGRTGAVLEAVVETAEETVEGIAEGTAEETAVGTELGIDSGTAAGTGCLRVPAGEIPAASGTIASDPAAQVGCLMRIPPHRLAEESTDPLAIR